VKKLTVVICTYNERRFVEDCLSNLEKIKNTTYPGLEVIVKDQASTDGSAELIEKKFRWVKLIRGSNDGISAAYNIGCKASTGDYLLFLGMDAFPEKETLPGMVNYFEENPTVGAAVCKLVLGDGSLDMDAHRAFPTPWLALSRILGLGKLFPKSRIFNGYFMPGEDMSQPHEIDLCTSHFMLVRREVLDEIGGFDEDFVLYGEDVGVCYRIKKAEWKIMYLPRWKARHLKGGSVGIRKTTRKLVQKSLEHRLKMQRLSTRAMRQFMEKHYADKYPKIVLSLVFFAISILGTIRVLVERLRR